LTRQNHCPCPCARAILRSPNARRGRFQCREIKRNIFSEYGTKRWKPLVPVSRVEMFGTYPSRETLIRHAGITSIPALCRILRAVGRTR
jgi:hypothetical protein